MNPNSPIAPPSASTTRSRRLLSSTGHERDSDNPHLCCASGISLLARRATCVARDSRQGQARLPSISSSRAACSILPCSSFSSSSLPSGTPRWASSERLLCKSTCVFLTHGRPRIRCEPVISQNHTGHRADADSHPRWPWRFKYAERTDSQWAPIVGVAPYVVDASAYQYSFVHGTWPPPSRRDVRIRDQIEA
jgi:hypothetical protein